uniref:Glutamine--fructose-6-phosphate aminotransferase [isomerizing] n=1 Tax=viral metagenome TaxID=1070528 RepID=A0A6C0DC42_9ZZZZ
MCGIVGYLGREPYVEYIMTGLKLLQNRGYDSAGISCIDMNHELITTKFASTNTNDSLVQLEKSINKTDCTSTIAIGHTRWATHGGKTDTNAHPHNDNKNRISIVHNGIIENFQELKNNLKKEGFSFRSQTDTEVIAVLIGKHLDNNETMENAIKLTISELSGTWALVIIHKDFPNKIWLTRNGSPLLLGIDEDFIMIASEHIAFSNYIKKYIVLDNHDLIEITKDGQDIIYNKNIHRYTIKEKSQSNIETLPSKYKHWMLKEIMEQPDAINRALNNGGRIENNVSVKLGGLDTCKTRLLDTDHLIILGCGTSYNAGLWAMDIFKSLDIFDTVVCYDGAEFNVKDIPKKRKSAVVLLSQSGETKDLHRCIQIAKDYDLITIGIVNVIDSQIARETDCGVYLNAGREVAVASTKSFTNQCVVLSMIAVWFSQNRGTAIEKRRKIISDLRNIPYQMQNALDNEEVCKHVASLLKENKSIFLLGKGRDEAIAKEGSLKLKEISYLHAEGYSTSSLKHGTFALIEENLPIVIIDITEEQRDKNRNAFQEVKARNAFIIRFTDMVDTKTKENDITIENNTTFSGLLVNIYIQLISYYIAILKGNNPDFPRNLAKVVTVE